MSTLTRIINILLLLKVLLVVSQSDVCKRCNQHPNSCKKIAGIFMVTVLSKGTYNPIVEIPAPACNINITELNRSRNYIALKTTRGKGIINGYWRVSSQGQYHGAATTFRYSKSNNIRCPGECIVGNGPTNETIVVQLLYYGSNPGVSYEFTIPNYVAFTPYEGSRLIPSVRNNHHSTLRNRVTNRRIIPNRRANLRDVANGERNPYGFIQRHEAPLKNRQELTLGGRVNEARSPARRYGYDTLGGRGLSYTQQINKRPRIIQNRRTPVVLAPRPRYVPPYSNNRGYNNYNTAALTDTSYERHIDIPQDNIISNDNLYEWKISGFTDCSEPCGGGKQETNVICVLKTTQVQVTDENCENSIKPRSQEVECNTSPCSPKWHVDEWAACSVTCGSGTQTRRLECKQKISATLQLSVSASLCNEEEKPAIAQQCEMERCAEWNIGPWKACSVSCGKGLKRRSVKCVDGNKRQIPTSYCNNNNRPIAQESCDMGTCKTHWLYTPWSNQCSSSCGAGVKTREVICYSKDSDSEVQSSICDSSIQPRDQVSCHSDESCGSKWFTGPWSECSSDCGSGVKNRYVVCMKVVGDAAVVSPDSDCWNSEKPTKEEDCNNHACGAEWFMTDWSQCSVTCGTGFKTREVKCLDRNKRETVGCDVNKRPLPSETCQPRRCPLKQLTAENDCRDLYRSCPLVVQSRLCSYKYYQQVCCASCRRQS